jgi:hypothetical protein
VRQVDGRMCGLVGAGRHNPRKQRSHRRRSENEG